MTWAYGGRGGTSSDSGSGGSSGGAAGVDVATLLGTPDGMIVPGASNSAPSRHGLYDVNLVYDAGSRSRPNPTRDGRSWAMGTATSSFLEGEFHTSIGVAHWAQKPRTRIRFKLGLDDGDPVDQVDFALGFSWQTTLMIFPGIQTGSSNQLSFWYSAGAESNRFHIVDTRNGRAASRYYFSGGDDLVADSTSLWELDVDAANIDVDNAVKFTLLKDRQEIGNVTVADAGLTNPYTSTFGFTRVWGMRGQSANQRFWRLFHDKLWLQDP